MADTMKEEDRKNLIIEPAGVMGMGKVKNVDEEDKPLILCFEFIRKTSDIRLLHDLNDTDFPTIIIMKGKEEWGRISKEYYDKACRIIDSWKGIPVLHVQAQPHSPVLIRGEDLGFILAPRIIDE